MKPSRYYVEWESTRLVKAARAQGVPDDAIDPASVCVQKDVTDLGTARLLATRLRREGNLLVCIYERKNLRDETPPEDPPGILWDWDSELVEEVE